SLIILAALSLGINGCGGGNEEQNAPRAISVKLQTLESAPVVDSSEYVGTLQARNRVSLAPRTDGRILQIFARQGDRVSQGDAIVRLEPTQEQENVNAAAQSVNVERARLTQSQAELRTAQANRSGAAAQVESARADLQDVQAEVELAQINIKRTRALVKGGALPRQNLDNDNRNLKTRIAQRDSRRETLNAAIESLKAADRQVEQARASIDSQNSTLKRAEAQLRSTSQNLAFNTINAPINGVIGSFDDKKVGDYVSVGEQLTTITNNQRFDLNINIPVEYRERLRQGLRVETVNEDGKTGIEGKITYIAPLTQQNTQSILTKVTFSNQGSLRDREYVRARVIWDEKPGILVPTSAVSTLGGQNFVYVAKKGKSQPENQEQNNESNSQSDNSSLVVQQQPIKLGSIQAQNYQVISGLKQGDRIAVSNILSLRDGTPIKPAQEQQAVKQVVSNE
ncbi:MAG: efflux RND transporter periplasmic adaptor subunit, partial [Cyanobacteria bacterium J06636_27]